MTQIGRPSGEVDVIHGHSSHHSRPIEIYNDKLILYGCGDFITDYEGDQRIRQFRDDPVLMYFPTVDSNRAELLALRMTALRMRKMQLVHPSTAEREWLRDGLAGVSRELGCDVELGTDGALMGHLQSPSRA